MKKKLLAAGVAVALGALSGVASAAVSVNAGGIGQINILPYYSVQDGNDTLISITNTDTVNGKAVKVRFRGAEWSDDVFDFQIFLSPGDMWTGAITKEGTLAKMSTSDTTCTLPASVNQAFVPIRLQTAAQATGTLEGYVEVITMADIPKFAEATDGTTAIANPLYTAVKHVANGAPPCRTDTASQTLLNTLGADNRESVATNNNVATLTTAAIVAANPGSWMTVPTSSLTSHSIIINVPTSKAFATTATAVNEAGARVKQYYRQANVGLGYSALITADRIFDAIDATAPTTLFQGAGVPMYQFDMPDLSTPTAVVGTTADAFAQRDSLATALTRASATTEYVTSDAILAETDVVLSQPVRRYFYEYRDITGVVGATAHLTLEGKPFYVQGEQTTVYGVLDGSTNRIGVGAPVFYDREENTPVASSEIVISPTPPVLTGSYSLKGEVSVLSINNSGAAKTGALNASLTINDYTGSYADGWATFSTTSVARAGVVGNGALPVIGFTAINLFNGSAGAAGTNYGMTLPLKN